MNETVNEKIQVLLKKAKEAKGLSKEETNPQLHIPNSLADNIKTREQANAFMTLLKTV